MLYLHGIGTGPSAWRPQVEALGGEAVDLVPLYARGWPATLVALERLVQERAPVDLCGLSLGALATLHVAAVTPAAIRRLVVCAGFARLPAAPRIGVHALALAAGLVPGGLLRRQLAARIPEPYRATALAEIEPLGARELSRLMRGAAGFRLEAERVRAPALVLWGGLDRANAALGRSLAAALPGAAAREIAGAGHVTNLDDPAGFSAALRAFLA